jgi:hypothetical protein
MTGCASVCSVAGGAPGVLEVPGLSALSPAPLRTYSSERVSQPATAALSLCQTVAAEPAVDTV